MAVRVVTADQAAARDRAAMHTGTPSLQLMRRAGQGAARILLDRVALAAGSPVHVFAGPGNNGGDGWIVAAALAQAGHRIHVTETAPARGDDARRAREEALPQVSPDPPAGAPSLVVDALLGTGASGPLRGAIADAAAAVHRLQRDGARVVSLDLPSGLDATTGELADGAVRADLTVTFGTVKRGQLRRRGVCGELVVADIGLGDAAALADGAPLLVDAPWVRAVVPPIAADAHKGTRGKILVAGGDRGMAGAPALAAHAALRSGVGMVRLCVHEASLAPVQGYAPHATAATWPALDAPLPSALTEWPDAILFGPGLGSGHEARRRVEQWLEAWRGPVVLDADALNAFAGDIESLGDLLEGRAAIITPHVAEFARLVGVDAETVDEERFEIGARVARALHAVVLLKGVPTVITAPDGAAYISASGTPALATAGSGDVLGGIAATLLAQLGDPLAAAAAAAWIHGRAAEIASAGRPVRGVTLDDVVGTLAHAWRLEERLPAGVLATLPAVGRA